MPEASATATQVPGETTAAAFSYSVDERGIARIDFDLPGEKVNKLSTPVMMELDRLIEELSAKKDIRAAVLFSRKDGVFIAGADIEEIRSITDSRLGEEAARKGQGIFTKLSKLPFPVVAAIDGACLGGGCELALACSHRVASDSSRVKIGLPEVQLGIVPGFGGTQRLPRLIGIQAALDLILTGKTLDGRRAKKAGLVDEVLPHDQFEAFALQFATDLAGRRKEPRGPHLSFTSRLLEGVGFGRSIIFSQARKTVQAKTGGHYPAPLKAIDAVQQGLGLTLEEGLALEARYLGEMIPTAVSKNLIRIFYLSEGVKKQSGVDALAAKPRPVEGAAVLGAGVMGGGIAQLLSQYDIPVRMKDIRHDFVTKGLAAARSVYEERLRRKRMTPRELERKMSLISGMIEFKGFRRVDLAIEAVVEDLTVKKKVLQETEEVLPPHAIFATNTSSLSVTELASASKRPENVVGMHFFNPVHRMPLVEVVRGAKSSDEAIATTFALAKKLGKTPIVVKDGPGFLVNRLLMPYLNEAGLLLVEGVPIDVLDKAMKQFGMPMGPMELLDEIGLDVACKAGHILGAAFPDRMQPGNVLDKMVEAGRLGKKGGKGFYRYSGKEKELDTSVYDIIPRKASAPPLSEPELQERMVLGMINEAARCLAEGLVRCPEDVDIGMIFGTGFPPFRGGLLRYADSIGSSRTVAQLQKLADRYGPRFEPAPALVEMGKEDRKFYAE